MIKIFVQKRWLTIADYNRRLKELGFYSYEAPDKPQDVPNKGKKLPGKAVSLWIHARNFPLIIKPFVQDLDDEVLKLSLLLVEITSRLTALEFRDYEISILEDKIIEFLDVRKEVFESYPELLGTTKPKHHFLTHYGQAIRLYGPPLTYWTGRFESKHRIAKNIAETSKNFKNISLTVSVRQMMRMASVYYRGMFETSNFTLPEKVWYKNDLNNSSLKWDKIKEFMSTNDLVCSEIVTNHQKYANGDIVVLEVLDGGYELKVGVIETVLVKKNKVFFVVKIYKAAKHPLGYFQSETIGVETVFTEAKNIKDFKPLIRHGTTLKFQFVTHHHISYDNI